MKSRSKYPRETSISGLGGYFEPQREHFLQSVLIWMAQHVILLNIFLSSADTHNSVKIKASGHFAVFGIWKKQAAEAAEPHLARDFFENRDLSSLAETRWCSQQTCQGSVFFKVILYLPLPGISRELKEMIEELNKNDHNLRILTVAFSRTDLQLPTMVTVIPQNVLWVFVVVFVHLVFLKNFKNGTKFKNDSLLFLQGLPACFTSEFLGVFNMKCEGIGK